MQEPMTVDVSDEELMRRVACGDRMAFTELAARYRGRIMRLAYGIVRSSGEAEDIVQETFLRIWTRACHWQPGRGAGFMAWAATIATNLAIDRSRRPLPARLDESSEVASPEAGAEERLSAKMIGRRIDGAMRKLPLRQRTAFVLCQINALTNGEAATAMGVSIGTVEQLLVRARRALRTDLADLLED